MRLLFFIGSSSREGQSYWTACVASQELGCTPWNCAPLFVADGCSTSYLCEDYVIGVARHMFEPFDLIDLPTSIP
jgi:hypothetical protein